LITIAEYIAWRQPAIYSELICWQDEILYYTVHTRGLERLKFGAWKRLMQERPYPGRGGILAGEVGRYGKTV